MVKQAIDLGAYETIAHEKLCPRCNNTVYLVKSNKKALVICTCEIARVQIGLDIHGKEVFLKTKERNRAEKVTTPITKPTESMPQKMKRK